MARYLTKEYRYGLDELGEVREVDNDVRTFIVQEQKKVDQVETDQATADQNDYPIPPGETLVQLVNLSTDASRTFTGFSGARHGLIVLRNSGSNNLVVAHDNAGSQDENKVISHTGANITLNPNESLPILYNFSISRWVTVGFI